MKLFRRRTTPQPSTEAREHMDSTVVELEQARRLRAESKRVGAALARVQEENHIALALSRAIRGNA